MKRQNGPGIPRRSWAGPLLVSEPSDLAKIHELRQSVWQSEPELFDYYKVDPSTLRDDHDGHGYHWIITVKGSVVAAARLCIHADAGELPYQQGFSHLITDIPRPIASLNRMVVHPSMRRQGVTRPLTEARIAAARAKGARSMIVEAVPNRLQPLLDLGFTELGLTEGTRENAVYFTLMYLCLFA